MARPGKIGPTQASGAGSSCEPIGPPGHELAAWFGGIRQASGPVRAQSLYNDASRPQAWCLSEPGVTGPERSRSSRDRFLHQQPTGCSDPVRPLGVDVWVLVLLIVAAATGAFGILWYLVRALQRAPMHALFCLELRVGGVAAKAYVDGRCRPRPADDDNTQGGSPSSPDDDDRPLLGTS